MSRYLLDTNVLLYARGGDHPYRRPCRRILLAAGDGALQLTASIELIGEYTHVLLRRGVDRTSVLEEVAEVRGLCRPVAFDADVLDRATALLRRHDGLGVRDAVHAATALHLGGLPVLSTDRVFDRLDEVRRVDPTEVVTDGR